MSRRALHRLTTTGLVVVSLLFSQLALASYICPMQSGAVAMAETMDAGMPCEDMDEAQPVLCHQHCTDASLSFEVAKLPAAALPALVQVIELPPIAAAIETMARPFAATAQARPPPDPLFLSTLRLRV